MGKELVFSRKNEALTTTLIIAEHTGTEHESIVRLFYKHCKNNTFAKLRFEIGVFKTGKVGQPTKFIYLNEEQATFLVTLMRNSERVVAFKQNLVSEFFKLRSYISNQTDPLWKLEREKSVKARKIVCSSIKTIVDLAKQKGNKKYAHYYYGKITILLYKCLGFDIKYGTKGIRNSLNVPELSFLQTTEFIIQNLIDSLVASGERDPSMIYYRLKSKLEEFGAFARPIISSPFLGQTKKKFSFIGSEPKEKKIKEIKNAKTI